MSDTSDVTTTATVPANDPWAAASAPPAPTAWQAPAPTQFAGRTPAAPSPLAAGFGAASGSSLLFNAGAAAPSLFNKTHLLGTERTGIIVSTTDKQDQDFNAKAPKYWSTSKVGGEMRNRATTTDAIDGPTGQPNRPVMVVHIELDTSYRMEAGEAVAVNRPADFGATDNGKRVEVVGGLDLKAFAEAMTEARARGINLADATDLVGKRLTVKRVGQKPNPGGNPSWVKGYRIDNA